MCVNLSTAEQMPQRRSYRKRQESSGSEREGEGEGVQDEAVR